MNEGLAVLSGVLIAVMIAINGELGNAVGTYPSSVIIHLVGLCAICLFLLLRRIPLRGSLGQPLPLYTGGVIGVFTVVANVLTVTNLDVSLTLALGLLGQLLTSIVVDTFGWLGAKKQAFESRRLLGLGLIGLGVVVMLIF